jgi:glycosyltransferase involved in cell wall biosynthesis
MTRVIHAITPGDHYSPRTGSAIPTVVHGLAGAANEDHRQPSYPQYVVLGAETYRPRYDSASAIEFLDVPGPSRNERLIDAALAPFGRPRRSAARYFQPLADALLDLEPAIVLAHNAPILPWLLRKSSHSVILYAHNDILRTLTRREAARTLGSVASIVCVSESLRAQTRIRLPRELRDRVVVVGNGVDCAQFAPSAPSASTGLRGSKLRVIFVGRMIAEKGPASGGAPPAR